MRITLRPGGNNHINIAQSGTGGPSIGNYNSGQNGLGIGNVRWNSVVSCLEVWDGYIWQQIYGPEFQISLTGRTEHIIEWAEKKMQQEKNIEEFAKKYPALKDAKDKFDILYTLITSGEE